MQFITLLLTIIFVFHPHVSRCAPVARNTTQLVSLLLDLLLAAVVTFPEQAEKQLHPYIGYDPTGHHGTVARRGAKTPTPQIRQPALTRPLPVPDSPLTHHDNTGPDMSPPPVRAKRFEAVQNVRKLPQHRPIRGPAPILRPAIFANGHHPSVHIARLPIQRPPLVAGHLNGPVHDIQKSSKWDPQYHAGVKSPRLRPY